MGQAKHKFEHDDVEVADFSRALALPARVTIIRILLEQQGWVENSRFTELPLAAKVTEKHLQALTVVKLINRKRRNGVPFYKLNVDHF